MFGLQHLTNAVRQQADNLAALAGTVGEANAGLRARLALETHPALPEPDPDGNGRTRKRVRAE